MHKCPNAEEMLGRIILMHLCGSNSPGSSFYATLPSTLLALFPNLSLPRHYNNFLGPLFFPKKLKNRKVLNQVGPCARNPIFKGGGGSNNNDDDDVNNSKDDEDGDEEVVQKFLCAKVDLPCVHWL